MPKFSLEFNPVFLYFVTTTAVDRRHLFGSNVLKRILIDCLYHSSSVDGTEINAFVIMPNHIHFIVKCRATKPLSAMIRDFKANSSRLILRQLQAERQLAQLASLETAVRKPGKQRRKVWEDGYFAREIFTRPFLRQKMTYIHHNPLQPHWRLVDKPEDYVWSSARFYESGEPALIPLSDARAFL